MKLSEAMEAGFQVTWPTRHKYYWYAPTDERPECCPIGAACVAALPPVRKSEPNLMNETKWEQHANALFPELRLMVEWSDPAEVKWRTSLLQMVVALNDVHRLSRDEILERVKDMGF